MSGGRDANQAEAVRVEGLTVRYGPSTAVDDVSLAVPRGAVYALLGRNGAGKSSLVRCVLGQQKPTAGRALLFGRDVWRERAALMGRLGVVSEEPDVPPGMTALALVRFSKPLYATWDAEGFLSRLERFGVPKDVPFGKLSKGQKGLVALGLALAPAPELLLLDDPTLGLDAVARKAVFEELIGDLADRGTTVFLTTHDLAGVEGLADRIGILRGGRLVLDEPMESLKGRFRRLRYANERTEARATYGDELDDFHAEAVKVRGWGIEAVVSNFTDEAFVRFAAREGVVDAGESALSLEEIFLSVAGPERVATRPAGSSRTQGGRP